MFLKPNNIRRPALRSVYFEIWDSLLKMIQIFFQKFLFYKQDENNKMDQCLDFKSFFFINVPTETRDKNQEKKRRGYRDLKEYSKLQ